MDSKENPNKNKNLGKIIIILSISAIVGYVVITTYFPNNSIQLSELPLDKLNQGYDLVCKSRDHQALCVYNETARTNINFAGQVNRPDPITNQTIVHQIYEITMRYQNTCLHEYDVDWKNHSNLCYIGKDFPKDVWTMTSSDNLYIFKNGTWMN